MITSLKDEVLKGNCLFHKNLGHQQPIVLNKNELHSQCWCSTDMAGVWCFTKSYYPFGVAPTLENPFDACK